MRPENSVWRGNFGYWQNSFIHTHLLVIGYFAWNGFVQSGRGLVVCNVAAKTADHRTTHLDIVPFTSQFIPEPQVANYLQTEGLERDAIALILKTIQHYDPQRELILFLTANDQPEVNLLQNLAITPPQCYEQVCKRWDEFMTVRIPNDSCRF